MFPGLKIEGLGGDELKGLSGRKLREAARTNECSYEELKLGKKLPKPTIRLRVGKCNKQAEIKLKSLILAQIERWRNALHMQVERQRGATWRRAANG